MGNVKISIVEVEPICAKTILDTDGSQNLNEQEIKAARRRHRYQRHVTRTEHLQVRSRKWHPVERALRRPARLGRELRRFFHNLRVQRTCRIVRSQDSRRRALINVGQRRRSQTCPTFFLLRKVDDRWVITSKLTQGVAEHKRS